jgi:hypothetical protein
MELVLPDTNESLCDPCCATWDTLQTHQFKLPGFSYEHNGKRVQAIRWMVPKDGKHLKGSIEYKNGYTVLNLGTKTSIRTHVKKGIVCITENGMVYKRKRGETNQEPTELISKTKEIFLVKPFMEMVWRQIELLLYFVEELALHPSNS